MTRPLPLYLLGESYVEAFIITQIEILEASVVLRGLNGIRQAVQLSYIDRQNPQVGGYYVCFADGFEAFVNASEFNSNFKPAG